MLRALRGPFPPGAKNRPPVYPNPRSRFTHAYRKLTSSSYFDATPKSQDLRPANSCRAWSSSSNTRPSSVPSQERPGLRWPIFFAKIVVERSAPWASVPEKGRETGPPQPFTARKRAQLAFPNLWEPWKNPGWKRSIHPGNPPSWSVLRQAERVISSKPGCPRLAICRRGERIGGPRAARGKPGAAGTSQL